MLGVEGIWESRSINIGIIANLHKKYGINSWLIDL